MGQFGNIISPFCPGGLNSASLCKAGAQGQGLFLILNSLVKFVIVVAGLYTFWNLIAAGYMFMSAAGEPKAIAKAWEKIWLSLIGLVIVAGSFILAAVFGKLIYGDYLALLTLRIFSP